MRILRVAGCAIAMTALALGCNEQPTAVDDIGSPLFKPGGGKGKPDEVYAVRDLGTPEGLDESLAYDINESTIVGRARDRNGVGSYGFVWKNDWQTGPREDMRTLDRGTGTWAHAFGINDYGEVVGMIEFEFPDQRAVFWEPSASGYKLPIELATLGGSTQANDINNPGQIVGHSFLSTGERRAVVWNDRDAAPTPLGTLGGDAWVRAINDQGWAVGASYNADEKLHPALWLANGTLVDLFAGAYSGQAWDITEPVAGTVQITGNVTIRSATGSLSFRAMVWRVASDGTVTEIEELPQGRSAHGVNIAGEVVGTVRTKSTTRPAMWMADRSVAKLPCLSKGRLPCRGEAINNEGAIVGFSYVHANGPAHAVLWTKK